MAEVLIIQTCIVNYGDDRGGVVETQGSIRDVPKANAATIVGIGRALYVNKNDDPSKGGLNTADPEMVARAKELVGETKKK